MAAIAQIEQAPEVSTIYRTSALKSDPNSRPNPRYRARRPINAAAIAPAAFIVYVLWNITLIFYAIFRT